MRDDGEGLYFSDLGPVDSSLVLNICTEISCLTGNSALLLSLLDVPLDNNFVFLSLPKSARSPYPAAQYNCDVG